MKEIAEFYQKEFEKINSIILEFSRGKSPLIAEISSHLINSGGKRIRPLLLMISSKLCDEKNDHFYNFAAAVELIHSATLLHDDVVDASAVRRGKKTANAIFDNKASILVGDYLFSIAFQLMVSGCNLTALETLAKASSIMADGEIMQLENSTNIEISIEKYLEIIFSKTAILFSASSKTAAIINSCDASKINALEGFGKNLGMIFQIIDDDLEYKSSTDELGKEIGNDFFEGKITLPIIFAYNSADENDKKIIKNLFEKNLYDAKKNQEDLNLILEIMNKYNVFEKSFDVACGFKIKALQDLEIFANSIYKEHLIILLENSFQRKK